MINVNKEKAQFEGSPEIIMNEIITVLKGANQIINKVIKKEHRDEIFEICNKALMNGEIEEENE